MFQLFCSSENCRNMYNSISNLIRPKHSRLRRFLIFSISLNDVKKRKTIKALLEAAEERRNIWERQQKNHKINDVNIHFITDRNSHSSEIF